MKGNDCYNHLKVKLTEKTANVGVIGLGYVGLPLAVELTKKGYTVFGIDVNEEKLKHLQEGNSNITGVADEDVRTAVNNKRLIPTNDFSTINKLDTISICVPTPLTKYQYPDVSYIESVVDKIRKYMHKELLIILESTTYPGTTEELIEKQLEKQGYVVGEDYFLCFSPERVDPGNTNYNTKNTPKVIGGTTKLCSQLAMCLYEGAVDTLVPVSSPKVAEMSKLLENTFRSINIGFINEVAMLCDRLGLDIWETIEAASTKPFGFMPFYPGPGVGGHCIPLDPMYLAWKGKGINFNCKYIELAQDINKSMPKHVVNKVGDILNTHGMAINGSKILLLGVSYKANLGDLRESPSLEIYESLKVKGAHITYNDPYVQSFKDKNGMEVQSIALNYEELNKYDCVLLVTNHDWYDYEMIAKHSRIVVDTKNAFKHIHHQNQNIFRLWGTNK
ncbi:UDP-N-acetyl-D-glucosamine dehydrogenase [Evansella vedderi]|uniref:UDP-N-acetyl-D-glucosamine dehydrogenase n=1 Tax=Evansella vedderi TaxID=38282 RepID=A0ABT9ZVU9_9BACI|nr:nucleotide sugar dehydrogenase [Evansella vedderi]MDQ0255363.1 UDP-N-acetyl-D-glucosamine dehydrogenase [Evansella vedderi]